MARLVDKVLLWRKVSKNPKQPVTVSFSGGKDSTAMLFLLLEQDYRIDEVIFFDTGWEFPEMLTHIEKVKTMINVPFTHLHPAKSLDEWMLEYPVYPRSNKAKIGPPLRLGYGWPSSQRRWCTREKVAMIEKEKIPQSLSYVGMAFDEKTRRSVKNPSLRYPLIDWAVTEAEALEYCYALGFDWGGLYQYFSRVSCYCCPLKKINELRTLRNNFPDLWQIMLNKESIMQQNGSTGWFKGYAKVSDLDQRFQDEDRGIFVKLGRPPKKKGSDT